MAEGKSYTIEDIDYIYRNMTTASVEEIAEHLGRSPEYVRTHIERMNMLYVGKLTKEERSLIHTYSYLGDALIFAMPNRPIQMIREELGVEA